MAPLPCSRIWRSSCFMQAQTPRRLMALTRSKLSAGSSAASVGGIWMPALLNAMSSRPKVVDGAVDQRGDLVLVGDVAGDAERLVPGGGQLLGGGVRAALVDVGEHDRGAGLRRRPGRWPGPCRSWRR